MEIKLNPKQLEAVTSTKDKVLVMAGAGTGKTQVLTSKIHYLSEHYCNESAILAFTFTNKAANSMLWRLNKILGRETKAQVSTFHSYCYSYVSFNYLQLGFTNPPVIIDDDDKSKLVKQIIQELELDYSNVDFVRNLSKVKNHAKLDDDFTQEERFIFNKIYHRYQEELINSNRLDFDDMIPMFLKLLENDECTKDEILNSIEYVLVDEFQDTNQIQYDLVKILSSRCNKLFLCGDEDQLIYSFRSSDISIFKQFQDDCDEIIILNQNYRSTNEILARANQLIEYNQNRVKKDLFSEIQVENQVVCRQVSDVFKEAKEVADKIYELHYQGIPYKDMAVLYRNNNQAAPVEKELLLSGMPYHIYGSYPLFKYKEIKALLSIYLFISNPNDWMALDNFYNSPIPRCEAIEYEAFKRYAKENNFTIMEAMKNYRDKRFLTFYVKLDKILEDAVTQTPEILFTNILEEMNFDKYIQSGKNQKEKYERILQIKDLILKSEEPSITEMINKIYLSILDDENKKDVNTQDGHISLMTIHRAKGLEFKAVFFIGCNEGIIPPLKISRKELEEERRLCFVGLTRAMRHLYIYSSEIHYINGQRKRLQPSTFLVEAGFYGEVDEQLYKDNWYCR